MRIGIACYSVYGGSGVVASELGLALAKRGHDVHFISFSLPFRLASYQSHIFFHEIERMTYPLFEMDPLSLSVSAKMAEVAEYEKLDILHSHYALPFAVCAYIARNMLKKHPLKTVTTLHGTDITVVGNDKSFFGITQFSIEQSDAVTCVSQSLKKDTQKIFGIHQDIQVIYNFINPDKYHPDFCPGRRNDFAKPEEKILVHISNFRPVKRLADVIQIFYRVQQQIPAQLLLVGDGPDRSMAQELVRDLDIQDKVHFLGKQDCVVGLLSISDLMLLPSDKESFGLAALEAMACEVPVIATNTGGLPEVVIDHQTGLLSPIGDVAKMSNDALTILTNPDWHQRLKKAAREHAVNMFNEETMISQYETLYQRLLNDSKFQN